MQVSRRSSSPGMTAIVAAAVIAALGIAAFVWWPRDSVDVAGRGAMDTGAPADADRQLREQDVPALDLPELGASDAFVREFVAGLSEHPQLASWLVTDELIYRFVRTTVSLAYGQGPREHVDFLEPGEGFQVQEIDGLLIVDPESYRRYDLLTETVTSVSTEGTARLYRQMYPLFEEAYGELGIPDATFDDMLAQAVDNLIAADIPVGQLIVEPSRAVYAFTDAGLEARTPAEKHLIRMGPDNAGALQAKLRELRDAIWVR